MTRAVQEAVGKGMELGSCFGSTQTDRVVATYVHLICFGGARRSSHM